MRVQGGYGGLGWWPNSLGSIESYVVLILCLLLNLTNVKILGRQI